MRMRKALWPSEGSNIDGIGNLAIEGQIQRAPNRLDLKLLNYSITQLQILVTWFKRQSGELDTSGERKVRTEGLWVKCDQCRQIIWKKDLEDNLRSEERRVGKECR